MALVVQIENPQEQYYPGQCIVGRVLCSFEDSGYVEVRVKLVGEELTCYPNLHRNWKANFLETKDVLLFSGDLIVGNHDFAFKVTLPRRIPSTYVGKYGHVKYFLVAWWNGKNTIKREKQREIMVFSPIDLNDMVNLWLVPCVHSDSLIVKKWLCIPEKIEMVVRLEREVFIVGDAVNVLVELNNSSRISISTVTVKLIVMTQAKVATPRQEFMNCHELLASDSDAGVGSFSEKDFTFKLKIPNVAEIPNFEKCSLFTQKGLLEVRAVPVKSSRPELKVETEVVLGHIPVEGEDSFPKISGSLVKYIEGKKCLPDPVVIRPLSYGGSGTIKPVSSDMTASAKANSVQLNMHEEPVPLPVPVALYGTVGSS